MILDHPHYDVGRLFHIEIQDAYAEGFNLKSVVNVSLEEKALVEFLQAEIMYSEYVNSNFRVIMFASGRFFVQHS